MGHWRAAVRLLPTSRSRRARIARRRSPGAAIRPVSLDQRLDDVLLAHVARDLAQEAALAEWPVWSAAAAVTNYRLLTGTQRKPSRALTSQGRGNRPVLPGQGPARPRNSPAGGCRGSGAPARRSRAYRGRGGAATRHTGWPVIPFCTSDPARKNVLSVTQILLRVANLARGSAPDQEEAPRVRRRNNLPV